MAEHEGNEITLSELLNAARDDVLAAEAERDSLQAERDSLHDDVCEMQSMIYTLQAQVTVLREALEVAILWGNFRPRVLRKLKAAAALKETEEN